MKRLLMYIVVAIVLISAGFSIYYVVRNNEEINPILASGETFYMNQGETMSIPLEHKHPSEFTELTLKTGYEEYLDVDLKNWTMTAKNAGPTTLEFVSTNEKYPDTFEISVYVGNGSVEYPYYIRNEADLFNIGNEKYPFSACYQLTTDIKLTKDMLPIGVSYTEDGTLAINEFTGTFSGGEGRHKIINARVIQGDLDYPCGGFFGFIGTTGKVEDVVFENLYVEGYHSYAGTIAGVNYGLIGKCEVAGKVVNTFGKGFTGGICGLNERSADEYYAQVNMCTSNVDISSKWVAGGAVGYNLGGVIFNCVVKTNHLNINSELPEGAISSYFGGIAGISVYGSNTGSFDDEDNIIVPDFNDPSTKIYDSYVSNSIAYIEAIENPSSKIGGIFGAYYGERNIYQTEGNYSMLFYVGASDIPAFVRTKDDKAISDQAASASGYVKHISHEESLVKSTFSSVKNSRWDFKNVWEIESGRELRLGYVRLDGEPMQYQPFALNGGIYNNGKAITNSTELAAAFEYMRENPGKNLIYEIANSISYDGNRDIRGKEWTPIGTKENPFRGQIRIADDAFITVRNIEISAQNEFAGLFGYVAGENTIIKNIIVRNVKVEGSTAGVIVGYNDGATIEGCRVFNFEITTDHYAGSIAGINNGVIKNCLVSATEKTVETTDANGNKTTTVYIDEETGEPQYVVSGEGVITYKPSEAYSAAFIGGAVAKNFGSLISTLAQKVSVDLPEASNATLAIGGGVAQNSGLVDGIEISYFTINGLDFKGSAYAGGVIGRQVTGTLQSAFVNDSNGIYFHLDNANIIAGGLVGCLEKETTVKYSSINTLNLEAYYVGGFAGMAYGNIDQCAIDSASTKITGRIAGGFACSLSGSVTNSMTASTIDGSQITAGMTVYLRKGAVINYCYINPTFKADSTGQIYAETQSEFRARPDNFGSIKNTIIVGNLKTLDLLGTRLWTWCTIDINGAQAKLQTSFATYAMDVKVCADKNQIAGTITSAGFSEGIWSSGSTDELPAPIKSIAVKDMFPKETVNDEGSAQAPVENPTEEQNPAGDEEQAA